MQRLRIRNNKSIYHGMQTTNQDKLSVEVEPFYHYILHFTFYKLLHSQRTTRYSRLEARLQILTKQKIAISPPPTHWISHTNTPLILLSYCSHMALILLTYCSHFQTDCLAWPTIGPIQYNICCHRLPSPSHKIARID